MGTIQQLQKIKGKRLAHKAASWLQRTYYRNFQGHPKPGYDITDNPLYGMLRYYRASEVSNIGPKQIVVTGNSRIHAAEPLIETSIPSCVVTAISGDIVQGVRKRLKDTVFAYSPRIVVDDSAGNNILQSEDLDLILDEKQAEVNEIKAFGAEVLLLEVGPVGAPYEKTHPGTNERIHAYNAALNSTYQPEEILCISDQLSVSPGGPMIPEYDSGDSVHHTPAAYFKVYIPSMQERLLQRGFRL